jgi:hypothetical protein
MTLVEDDGGGWSARQGDVAVRVTRPRAHAIRLAVELASGCTVRGTLVRATTRVAACDRLLGWTRIAARCTKPGAPRDAITAPRTTRWRKADAARCEARADTLALALVDAGCAPHPDPAIGVRAAACRAVVEATGRLGRCGRVPAELARRLDGTARALAAAAQSADAGTLGVVERQCRDAAADVASVATRFGCP